MWLIPAIATLLPAIAFAQNENAGCGSTATDFAPCVARERADTVFQQCCKQFAPIGCQPLCTYEAEEAPARALLMHAVKTGKCDLKNISSVLFCASQNQDNRKCCEHLSLSDPKLGTGDRCLRFCDPAGDGIATVTRADVTCLFNWNVIMYCHHSGIQAD